MLKILNYETFLPTYFDYFHSQQQKFQGAKTFIAGSESSQSDVELSLPKTFVP